MTMRYVVRFTGIVQGVGFRMSAERMARDFAVVGFVRNEPDGSVLLIAESTLDELDRFIATIRRSRGATIERVDIERHSPTGEFEKFEISR